MPHPRKNARSSRPAVSGAFLQVLLIGAALAQTGDAPAPAKAASPESYTWNLPPGFPEPRVPADNPMSEIKVQLGRRLFHDTRLSLDGTMACATCHRPQLAFTDGLARAQGVTGEKHPRGAMSLANVAYATHLNWDDERIQSLEEQLTTPLFGHDPIEMGLRGGDDLVEKLSGDWPLELAFQAAFPDDPAPLSAENVGKALAAFQRTLISGRSDFDRYMYGDEPESLSPPARRGMRLFFGERLGCAECHGRFTFSGPITFEGASEASKTRRELHNTGLYDLGDGAYPANNRGLERHTGEAGDRGRFKAPTLRNIAVTAPYMHDGSMHTLEEVIDHYAAGGRAAGNPYKSPELTGFHLACDEREDLVAFLASLTDWSFLEDPRFRPPDEHDHSHK